MYLNGQVGPQVCADSSNPIVRQGKTGELNVADAHARYYEPTYRSGVFSVSLLTSATVTAYVGAAGGTPAVAVWNPAGSGKNLAILNASFMNVLAASAAGVVAWGLYFGITAAITQATTSAPLNMGTMVASGSVATGFKNVALTSGTVALGVISLGTYYWATAAGALLGPGFVEIGGSLIIPPGSYAAIGGSAAPATTTWNAGLSWEEVAI